MVRLMKRAKSVVQSALHISKSDAIVGQRILSAGNVQNEHLRPRFLSIMDRLTLVAVEVEQHQRTPECDLKHSVPLESTPEDVGIMMD